jgi:hypothetical protein
MKHLTRAVLVVVLLLVVVGTASAECGWVMNPPSNDRGMAGWLLKGGFRTLDECERASAALRRYSGHEGAVVVPSFCACRFEWSQRDVQGQAVQDQRTQKPVTDERESSGDPGGPKDR